MRKETWCRLVCWNGERVTGMSEPMPRDSALTLFAECVARGAYTPNDDARLTVLSVADCPDISYRPAA
jgi:hypothetical protein